MHSPEAMKFRASGIANQKLVNVLEPLVYGLRGSRGVQQQRKHAASHLNAVSDPSVYDWQLGTLIWIGVSSTKPRPSLKPYIMTNVTISISAHVCAQGKEVRLSSERPTKRLRMSSR